MKSQIQNKKNGGIGDLLLTLKKLLGIRYLFCCNYDQSS